MNDASAVRRTHIALDVLLDVRCEVEPALLVDGAHGGILGGECVLELETGGHARHGTVGAMVQDVRERLHELGLSADEGKVRSARDSGRHRQAAV